MKEKLKRMFELAESGEKNLCERCNQICEEVRVKTIDDYNKSEPLFFCSDWEEKK